MKDITYLMTIDADSSSDYWFAVTIERTEAQELIIKYQTKYKGDEPNFYEKGSTHQAILDAEETKLLANHLNVELSELTTFFSEEFDDSGTCAHACDGEYLFADILDFILDCGAKYKLK